MTQEIVSYRQAEATAGGRQVGVCVLLERDEGLLPVQIADALKVNV